MSGRGRPRKVQDENPGASAAPNPRATQKKSAPRNEEQVDGKQSTDAVSSCPSEPQVNQQVRSRKSLKDASSTQEPQASKTATSRKKVAARCSSRRDNSVQENPSKDPESAPETVRKSQRSASAKTTDNASCPPKLQVSQQVKDPNSTEETQAPKTAKSGEKKTSARETPPTCSRRASSIEENPSKVLQNALEKVKLKKNQRSESAKCVNEIQNKVIEHLKRHLDWCADISVLKTGSYYENLKICEPDEFDVMLTVSVGRVKILPFSEDGAFYSVEMKRHARHPLDKFVNEDDTIMASEMLKQFREKVKEAVAAPPFVDRVTLERKKMGCPAVTLLAKEKGKDISIDFVLGLEVPSNWPDFTQDGLKIEHWLSKKVRMDQRRRPFYLVPKHEGRGNAEQDGIRAKDAWRISFSHVEKHILKNHGNSKTCCEGGEKCCRKQCLKLLKYLLQRLKEKYPDETDNLCSYHAKTTLLHACATRVKDSEWAGSDLSYCFQKLLRDFETHLRAHKLPNFFIPSQNLFSGISKKKCNLLAGYIEKERNNGFPLLC